MKLDRFADNLRSVGMKATPVRLALYNLFVREHAPMTAEVILRKIGFDGIDLSTLYRNLQAFEEAGLTRRIPVRKGVESYELVRADDHHHLICEACGKTEDFEGCGVAALAKKALGESKQFGKITSHVFELYGLCKGCSRKSAHV